MQEIRVKITTHNTETIETMSELIKMFKSLDRSNWRISIEDCPNIS